MANPVLGMVKQVFTGYLWNPCARTRLMRLGNFTILGIVLTTGCGPPPEGEQCDICPVAHAIVTGQVTLSSGTSAGRVRLVVRLARASEPDNSLSTVAWESEDNGSYTREVTNSNLGPFMDSDSIRTTVVVQNSNFETLGQASKDGLTFKPIHEVPDTLRIDVVIQSPMW